MAQGEAAGTWHSATNIKLGSPVCCETQWVFEPSHWHNHRSAWRHLRHAKSMLTSTVLRALWKPVLIITLAMLFISIYDTARTVRVTNHHYVVLHTCIHVCTSKSPYTGAATPHMVSVHHCLCAHTLSPGLPCAFPPARLSNQRLVRPICGGSCQIWWPNQAMPRPRAPGTAVVCPD